MPVTARLSQKFYQRFGDELTNELVDWMNQVDTSYRSEFRELFEVHFSRFDAELRKGLAELKEELRAEIAASRAEALRWNFLFWIGTVGSVAALLKL